jgi:hypothetical protein
MEGKLRGLLGLDAQSRLINVTSVATRFAKIQPNAHWRGLIVHGCNAASATVVTKEVLSTPSAVGMVHVWAEQDGSSLPCTCLSVFHRRSATTSQQSWATARHGGASTISTLPSVRRPLTCATSMTSTSHGSRDSSRSTQA